MADLPIATKPGEGADQPTFTEIEQAARQLGMEAHYLPVESGKVSDQDAEQFRGYLDTLPRSLLAYCCSGMRSATLWALASTSTMSLVEILAAGKRAGVDLSGLARRIGSPHISTEEQHDVVIIGAGAAGVATASSLLDRAPNLDIAIIDPADVHYYQPGWTMVGAGVFRPETTARPMGGVLPRNVRWIKSAVAAFEPTANAVILEGCRVVKYRQLVVCPGLKLDWNAIEGLPQTLGRNGVTSNYRYDLAPYTWQRVQQLKGGRALFTQPPMPIKCAGAPQKAMYLSCDHWRRTGRLNQINVEFYNAGAALFGVADYVPALMKYVESYGIDLNFGFNLTAVDGEARRATFTRALPGGGSETFETGFDLLHVVPPQKAPDFIRVSPLADACGWVDVDQGTLRHKVYENIFGLGDVTNTPNAKTASAARKQAPVVAHNVLAALGVTRGAAIYDGYGSCPLTVERGKIVLAEFLYGGKVAPTFPGWIIDGKKPSGLAWLLKERILPPLYWQGMLKGREWFVQPQVAD
ncbi:beta-lactamase hydrolase domain-containing protein [Paraburkholderia sp. A3BS-1L]|uniref:beta-lactamase hydrolase domain-containing protein n=1 Tax=Paraburkholderia sp. A3BS-1L TaxID=3028375 RepID=UPI003DA8595E